MQEQCEEEQKQQESIPNSFALGEFVRARVCSQSGDQILSIGQIVQHCSEKKNFTIELYTFNSPSQYHKISPLQKLDLINTLKYANVLPCDILEKVRVVPFETFLKICRRENGGSEWRVPRGLYLQRQKLEEGEEDEERQSEKVRYRSQKHSRVQCNECQEQIDPQLEVNIAYCIECEGAYYHKRCVRQENGCFVCQSSVALVNFWKLVPDRTVGSIYDQGAIDNPLIPSFRFKMNSCTLKSRKQQEGRREPVQLMYDEQLVKQDQLLSIPDSIKRLFLDQGSLQINSTRDLNSIQYDKFAQAAKLVSGEVCQHLDFDALDELLRDQDFRCFVRRHSEEELARMSTVLLGYCYEKGLYDSEDFEQNFEKAYWLYHSAALQGQVKGIYFFARLYAFGRGVMLNHEFAATLLITHSEQGQTLCDQQILSLLAYLSHFVPQAWQFLCKHIASIKSEIVCPTSILTRGLMLWKEGLYEVAAYDFLSVSDKGDKNDLFMLAHFIQKCVPSQEVEQLSKHIRQPFTALYCYLKSADKGCVEACTQLYKILMSRPTASKQQTGLQYELWNQAMLHGSLEMKYLDLNIENNQHISPTRKREIVPQITTLLERGFYSDSFLSAISKQNILSTVSISTYLRSMQRRQIDLKRLPLDSQYAYNIARRLIGELSGTGGEDSITHAEEDSQIAINLLRCSKENETDREKNFEMCQYLKALLEQKGVYGALDIRLRDIEQKVQYQRKQFAFIIKIAGGDVQDNCTVFGELSHKHWEGVMPYLSVGKMSSELARIQAELEQQQEERRLQQLLEVESDVSLSEIEDSFVSAPENFETE